MEKKRFAISIWKWRSQILLLTLSEVPKYEHQGFYDLIETYESVLKTLLSKNRPIHFYPSYLFSLLLLQVRRAAAKCLEAVISTRHELLDEFYNSVSPALIGRFKEREENVKAGMYLNYQILGLTTCFRAHTSQNSFYKWTKISSLKITIFYLKMMVKSGLDFLF